MIFIFGIINLILQINVNENSSNSHRRIFLDVFEITKGGKILFTIVSMYILFTSITLPVIKYFTARRTKSKNVNDVSLLSFNNSTHLNVYIYIYNRKILI